jgi:hypothetical protein
MRIALRLILAVSLAGSLAVVFCRPAPGPVDIEPPAEPPADTWPDRLAVYVAREQVARAAAAGRRSLAEAAALFRALAGGGPAAADAGMPPLRIPADTEAGRLCRQVVLCADAALRYDGPGVVDEAVDCLEAEYFAAVGADGVFPLPDAATVEPVEAVLQRARAWIAEQERRHGPGPRRPSDSAEDQ